MDEHGPDAPESMTMQETIDKYPIPPEKLEKFFGEHPPDTFSISEDQVRAIMRPPSKPERLYLPTLPELIDRLAITQLKAIFIPEHAEAYRQEMALIMHDVDLILAEQPKLDAEAVRAILILMLANRFIWENESKARAGGPEQDKLLKLTHSINGIRNQAKNVIASKTGGRKDWKTDCLAADLPVEYGDWKIFS